MVWDVEIGARVVALLLRHLAQVPRVGRRRPDDGGLVLLQHEQQAVRGHGAHPDGQRAQALRADDVGAAHVQREVERMHVAVVRAHAGLPEQARLGILPQVEVLLREGAHRGDARGAGRGGHEDDLLLGYGAHLAEEAAHVLRLALRLLVDERELGDIVERFDIARRHAGLVERAAVVRRVLVCVGHHVLQALQLQRLELGPRHAFDLRIVVFLGYGDVLRHGCSLIGSRFLRCLHARGGQRLHDRTPSARLGFPRLPARAERFTCNIRSLSGLSQVKAAHCMKPLTGGEYNLLSHSMF